MTVIAYATSDWHLLEEAGAGAWRDLPGVTGDAVHALAHVVNLAVQHRVPLLAAGDLADGPDPTPEALAEWFTTLRPLLDVGLPLLYVCGNHERGRDWLAALGPQAIRLDGRVVHMESGHTVSGLGFISPDRFEAAANSNGRLTDIGLYHQALAELAGGRGLPIQVFPPHRLTVVGDTHVGAIIPGRAGLILSPGPLTPQSIAEFGPAGVWAVADDLTVERVPIPMRTYHTFTIDSVGAADRCALVCGQLSPDTSLPEQLSRPLVAIRITTDIDGFVPTIRELAKARDFVVRIVDVGRTDSTSPEIRDGVQVKGMDLVTAARAWFSTDPAARDLAEQLAVPGADPSVVLATARARYEAEAAHEVQMPDGDIDNEDPTFH